MLNFLGIGAQKAGTTWLYERLKLHPQIKFPAGKEVHFWDMHYEKGVDWYKDQFPDAPGIKNGDITPAYSILLKEKIKELHKHFPGLALIYIIRDPIARAWSAALMDLRKAGLAYEAASDQWFIDHFNSPGSLMRGDYEACISNWREFYPENSLLIIDFEKIKSEPHGILRKVAEHLSIETSFYEKISEKNLGEKVYSSGENPIRASLIAPLEKIYSKKGSFYENFFKKTS